MAMRLVFVALKVKTPSSSTEGVAPATSLESLILVIGVSLTALTVSRNVSSALVSLPLLAVPPSSERPTVTTVVP